MNKAQITAIAVRRASRAAGAQLSSEASLRLGRNQVSLPPRGRWTHYLESGVFCRKGRGHQGFLGLEIHFNRNMWCSPNLNLIPILRAHEHPSSFKTLPDEALHVVTLLTRLFVNGSACRRAQCVQPQLLFGTKEASHLAERLCVTREPLPPLASWLLPLPSPSGAVTSGRHIQDVSFVQEALPGRLLCARPCQILGSTALHRFGFCSLP